MSQSEESTVLASAAPAGKSRKRESVKANAGEAPLKQAAPRSRAAGAASRGKKSADQAAAAKPAAVKPAAPRPATAKPASKPAPQPIGPLLEQLPPGRKPDGRMLFGRTVTLEPLDVARHAQPLYDASHGSVDPEGRIWTYMFYGPWDNFQAFRAWIEAQAKSADPLFFAIVPRVTRKPAGMAAYMSIRPEAGVIEIGNIWLAPVLQKTREATEAIFLLMRHAFEELGIRRLEWKCDSLNAPSRAAAARFGFTYEGVFRKHMVVKGRNRDTAWFSMTDDEWPAIRAEFQRWLDDRNFDQAGRQLTPLNPPTRGA